MTKKMAAGNRAIPPKPKKKKKAPGVRAVRKMIGAKLNDSRPGKPVSKPAKPSKSTTGIQGGVGGGGIGTAGPPGSAKGEAAVESMRRTLRQFKADVRQELEGLAAELRAIRAHVGLGEEPTLKVPVQSRPGTDALADVDRADDIQRALAAPLPVDDEIVDQGDPDAEARASSL